MGVALIKAKRFWSDVEVREGAGGFAIWLDERELKTPYKNEMRLPNAELAEAVAEEWRLVEGEIDPNLMPLTRMCNSAIERIASQRAGVQDHLLEYLENDLLVYRAGEPEKLVERQKLWDAPMEWARSLGIELEATKGIMAIDQPEGNGVAARGWIERLNDYQLVSFYEYVVITGSFVLGMAVIEGEMSVQAAFDLSRLDEDFQAEIWGMVDVKKEERDQKLGEILLAERFYKLSL